MSDLVGNAARSGAITCVVSPRVAQDNGKPSAHDLLKICQCNNLRHPGLLCNLSQSCACCYACAHACQTTMQIVASPVIGKVVMVGTDRTIGTVAGGVTGWLSFLAAYHMTQSHYLWQYAVLCVMVFIFGWASVVFGW